MEAGGNPFDVSVDVELRGLSIYTHHGVSEAEQEIGQRLEFDVMFDVPDCDAVLTDRVEDTIDYGDVADIVALAATERSYRTLERLAHVVGERLAGALRLRAGPGPRPRSPSRRFPWRSRRCRSRCWSSARSSRRGRRRGLTPRTGYLGLGSNVGERRREHRAGARSAQPRTA